MFYETYEEPELLYENTDENDEQEDEYRQDRMEEMVSRFGGY